MSHSIRDTPCPDLAHEKHTTVAQSQLMGPGHARESATGTPGSNRCNKVSMSVIPVLGGGVGFGAVTPASNRCNRFPTLWVSVWEAMPVY